MNKLFQIGDFVFRLFCSSEITPPPNFMLFEVEQGEEEYTYQIVVSETFPPIEGEVIARRADLLVYQSNKGEGRMLGVKGIPGYYAYYQELSANQAKVVLLRNRLRSLHIDPFFNSMLALEKRMLLKNSLILHCTYVRCGGKAILFSGPSGIGKSTQGSLWEKYRLAEIINGDRALLRQIDNLWYSCGWPVCGSSDICHNKAAAIHAIVMLSQGRENHVRRLSSIRAFTQLYSQITVNQWDREAQNRAINLLERLVTQVPVFHFQCNISEEAIICLEQAIYCGTDS